MLYEAITRVSSGPLSSTPGLAKVFLDTVTPGAGARGLTSPATVIWSTVLSLRVLEVLADTLCRSRDQFRSQTTGASSALVLKALNRIFTVDHPEVAPPYFLSCVRDQSSLEMLLSDVSRLHALSLPEEWHVPPAGDRKAAPERAFGLMTFQVGGLSCKSPLGGRTRDFLWQLACSSSNSSSVSTHT